MIEKKSMLKIFYSQFKSAIVVLCAFTFLIGVVYTGAITIFAQILFPQKANGSLVVSNNKIIGSKLIGQYFSSPKYFWGRPSATGVFPYNSADSKGSNLGPTNPKLIAAIHKRIEILKKSDPENKQPIPIDLVTASGSGLDPEISPLAAIYQLHRVANARNMSDKEVLAIVNAHIQKRQFGFLGEPRVNVLQLNMALDAIK